MNDNLKRSIKMYILLKMWLYDCGIIKNVYLNSLFAKFKFAWSRFFYINCVYFLKVFFYICWKKGSRKKFRSKKKNIYVSVAVFFTI